MYPSGRPRSLPWGPLLEHPAGEERSQGVAVRGTSDADMWVPFSDSKAPRAGHEGLRSEKGSAFPHLESFALPDILRYRYSTGRVIHPWGPLFTRGPPMVRSSRLLHNPSILCIGVPVRPPLSLSGEKRGRSGIALPPVIKSEADRSHNLAWSQPGFPVLSGLREETRGSEPGPRGGFSFIPPPEASPEFSLRNCRAPGVSVPQTPSPNSLPSP